MIGMRQYSPCAVACLVLAVTMSMFPGVLSARVFAAGPAPTTITVNSTTDTGACNLANTELRCAITQANTACQAASIACVIIQFNIPTTGQTKDPNCNGTPVVCTFTPGSDLPALTGNYVTIDGYSQPGAVPNSNADPRAQGDNAQILIEITQHCLTLGGSHETVQGLSLTSCTNGLLLSHADHATVQGNFAGLAPDGKTVANDTYGIRVTDASSNNTVGGTLTGGATASSLGIGSANVIAGNNTPAGIDVSDGVGAGASTNNVIKGNIVGTLADAVTPNPNIGTGILIEENAYGQVSATIGGSIPPGGANGDGNLVGGAQDGITISQDHPVAPASATATLLGNFVGVSPTGTAVGNTREGVSIRGGAHAILGQTNDNYAQGVNTIAYNGFSGVYAGYPNADKSRVGIYRNAIYGNNEHLGFAQINLQNPGLSSGAPAITCTADAPPLANEGILCPVITAVSSSEIDGTSCANCTIDVYAATNGINDLNHGGARRWLGATSADANGHWVLASFLTPFDPGQQAVTATATKLDASGVLETSEFAANVSAPDHAFVVTKTGDSPKDTPCEDASASYEPTLRCAVSEANVSTATSVSPGNSITFAIPSQTDPGCKPETIAGAPKSVCRITFTSALPPVSGNDLTIDGYSQPGASPNTNPHPLSQGDNAVILIELDTTDTGGNLQLFSLGGSHQTVQGFSLFETPGGSGTKIDVLPTAQFASIQGNLIGLDADGSLPVGNSNGTFGVAVEQGAHDTTIGGTLNAGAGSIGVGAVNVITDNFYGVEFYPRTGTLGANNVVKGNIIGANVAATSSANMGNYAYGIFIINATGTTIGGTTMTNDGVNADANLIAGWPQFAIAASSSPNTTIQGNFIGVSPTGSALANNAAIFLARGTTGAIGGANAAAGNTIAHNTNGAIFIGDGTNFPDQVAIQHNSMFANGNTDGIILAGQQPSACTLGPPDAQVYPNEYLPCPTLTTTTTTKLAGQTCSGCTVDVYIAPSASDKEGQTWIGSVDAGACNGAGCTVPWSISSAAFATPVTAGQFVTATATAHGQIETSEFAPPVAITQGQAPVLVVNTTQDVSPPCNPATYSLRCAITDANNDGTGDSIHFDIGGCPGSPAVCTLTLGSKLPVLTATHTTIDGYSQPGASANTHPLLGASGTGDNVVILIELDGSHTGNESTGLNITGNDNTVLGLSIVNFSPTGIQAAIHLNGSTGSVIAGNFIGILPDGATAGPNATGILADNGATANTFGGTQPADENVISGNTGSGIRSGPSLCASSYSCSTPGNDIIKGNAVGTDAAGTHAVPNGTNNNVHAPGISASGASDIISGNLVSGNAFTGLFSFGDTSTIQGNYVGTDASGTAAIGNAITGTYGGTGFWHNGLDARGTGTLIGGTAGGEGNLVSGNGDGTNNSVGLAPWGYQDTAQGNIVGTDITGSVALPNRGYAGMEVSGGAEQIGGTAAGARNLVSGNVGYGIAEDGGNTTYIQGNYVGTDSTGTKAVPNTSAGLRVDGGDDVVGGPAAGAGNLVSGNAGAGMVVDTPNNTIQGNLIGTDVTGATALANGTAGIDSTDGPNMIGGSSAGEANVIGGNSGDGIDVHPAADRGTVTVEGNQIGVPLSGSGALGNQANGIHVYPSAGAGGPTAVQLVSSNTIANNGGSGVLVGQAAGETQTHVTITRNTIFANGGLGIDLAPQGTVDCATAPPGPNDYIACPIIGHAKTSGIDGTACNNCTVEVFIATADPGDQGHGQAQTYLGTATANGSGAWVLDAASFATTVTVGQPITATATAPTSPGPVETSEFAANVAVHTKALPGVVTTTADLAQCGDDVSLRCAITSANAKGADFTISFDIPPSDAGCANGVCTIAPATALPSLNAPHTVIDGYSQPTASPNSEDIGDNAVIAIRLDGKNAPAGTDALVVGADHVTIQGLSITGYRSTNSGVGGNAIRFVEISASSGKVLGDFIGVAPDGVTAATNYAGIDVAGGAIGVQIGSSSPGDRNLINAAFAAIQLRNSKSNVVQGNYIGVDGSGNTGIPHIAGIIMTGEGLANDSTSGDTIGGSQPAAGNVISANVSAGIVAAPMPNDNSATFNAYATIQNNVIGPNAAGTAPVTMPANNGPGFGINLSSAQFFKISSNIIAGNKGDGLFLGGPGRGSSIDGNNIGVGTGGVSLPNGGDGIDVALTESDTVRNNTIANNKGWGMQVGQIPSETPHMLITRNSFAANTRGGIVLPGQSGNSCFYPGSAGHPNDYTPCPIIKSATTGQITGEACAGCLVEIFITPGAADDEGQTLLGLALAPTCTAPCTGITTWAIKVSNFQAALAAGQYVTATATAPAGAFAAETSQFSWAAAVGRALTVTTTADNPTPCALNLYSLRCAIDQANTDGAGDSISFAIPPGAPGCRIGKGCSIALTAPLPSLAASWTAILGYTQPGARANTHIPLGSAGGTNALVSIQLLAAGARNAPDGLAVSAAHVDIEGLAIQQFRAAGAGNAIHFSGPIAQYDIVSGNFLGMSRDGSTRGPNNTGVFVDGGAANELIGLLTPGDTNLLSGNTNYGVELSEAGKNAVTGNLIGTNAVGAAAAANGYSGILLLGTDGNIIGGSFVGAGNLISGNVADGIDGIAASNTTVRANDIGIDATGTKAIPNGLSGIYLYTGSANTIGGATDALGNVIGGNGGDGVDLLGDAGDSVTHNLVGTGTSAPAGGVPNHGAGILVANTLDNSTFARRPFLPPTSSATGGHHILTGTVSQNVIGGNGGAGVQIGQSRTENDTHVLVSQNSIAANKGQGIRLAGMSPGCVPSTAYGHGPNDNAVCPTITTQTTTDIEGSSCGGCSVEVFVASALPSDNNRGQGMKYLGTAGTGFPSFQHWILRLPAGVLTPGQTITAVTIRPASSTVPAESSQFSANVRVTAGP